MIKNKFYVSKLEILIIVVMLSIVLLGGICFTNLITTNKNISNFKSDTDIFILAAKNAYKSFDIMEKTENIVVGNDGQTRGMCITLKGLYLNDFIKKEYKDWDGYIVVEEASDGNYNYAVWLTNGKYVIDGYDESKINDLTLDNGITKDNKREFSVNVRNSFTGTSYEKGGTGSRDGNSLKIYNVACINEKIV